MRHNPLVLDLPFLIDGGGAFDAAEYIVRSKVEFAESLLSSFTNPATFARPIVKVMLVSRNPSSRRP